MRCKLGLRHRFTSSVRVNGGKASLGRQVTRTSKILMAAVRAAVQQLTVRPKVLNRQTRELRYAILEPLELKILFGGGWNRGPEIPGLGSAPALVCTCTTSPNTANPATAMGSSALAPNVSTGSVASFTGAPVVESTDLVSTGFGKDFGIVRSWSGLNESSQLGNGWMIDSLPYLVIQFNQYDPDLENGELSVVKGAETQEAFIVARTSNTCWAADSSNSDTLTYFAPSADGVQPGYFQLRDSAGGITSFYDVPRDSGGAGRINGAVSGAQQPVVNFNGNGVSFRYGAFKSYQDAEGNVTSATYDSSTGDLSSLTRVDISGEEERFRCDYGSTPIHNTMASADLIQSIYMERRTSGTGSWGVVQRADYQYYTGQGSDSANGRLGDLKYVGIYDYQNNPSSPDLINQKYYRYDKLSTVQYSNTGIPGYDSRGPTNYPSTTGGTDPGYDPWGGDNAVVSGLAMVVEGNQFDELASACGTLSSIESQSNATISQFAQHSYSYERFETGELGYTAWDDRYRVVQETTAQTGCSSCTDGFGTTTYAYSTSTSDSSNLTLNDWLTKVTAVLPDDTPTTANDNPRIVTYCNKNGQVLLQDSQEYGPGSVLLQSITAYRYDDYGRLITELHPSAIIAYNEYPGLYVPTLAEYVNQNSGLIDQWHYADSTTANISLTQAGDVQNYLQSHGVQQGAAGTEITLESWTYKKILGDGTYGSTFPVATDTVYPLANATNARTTSYSYTQWQDPLGANTTQIESESVISPAVTTSQNGSNSCTTTTSVYDSLGRVIWTKDANGYLTYSAYDSATGSLVEQVQDADPSLISGAPVSAPSGVLSGHTALALKTVYTVDKTGRTVKVVDPLGHETDTIYDDFSHAVFCFNVASSPSSGNGTLTTVGPVQMIRNDLPYTYTYQGTTQEGTYDEQMTFSGGLTVQSGKIVLPGFSTGNPSLLNLTGNGNTTSPQFTIQSLSRGLTNSVGQEIESDAYSAIDNTSYLATTAGAAYTTASGSHFDGTKYGYDNQGRQDKLVSPLGTITRTVFDGRGNAISTWVGTDDETTTGYWSPTNTAGSNLVKTSSTNYDAEGNLLQTTAYPGGSAAPRVTVFGYDWRDRQTTTLEPSTVAEDGTHQTLTVTTYDNADEGVEMDAYDTHGVANATIANSTLTAKSTTSYDNQSRSYETVTFSVNPSNGSVSGSGIVSDTWYDGNSNVIESHTSGGAFTKTVYDGAGRPTLTYTTDGGTLNGNGTANMTWAAASSVSNDIVLNQSQAIYDANGNVIETINSDRDNNDGVIQGALGNQTLTIPAADSPTGANLTLTWVADVSRGSNVGPGYASASNLNINDWPANGTAVWILPPATAAADASNLGLTTIGSGWAFVVTDSAEHYLDGEFGNLTIGSSNITFANGTDQSDDNPLTAWLGIENFVASQTSLAAARVSYTVAYYDAANRDISDVNVGTNGGVALVGRPPAGTVSRIAITGTGGTTLGTMTWTDDAYNLTGAHESGWIGAISGVGQVLMAASNATTPTTLHLFVSTSGSPGTWTADAGTADWTAPNFLSQFYVALGNAGITGGNAVFDGLVTKSSYNAAGELDYTVNPNQSLSNATLETKYFYDALGRTLFTVAAYDGTYDPTLGGQPLPSSANDNQTTAYTYDGDGHTLTMTAIMPGTVLAPGTNQTTQYFYGVTTVQGSALDDNDLLWKVEYPDPTGGAASSSHENVFTYDALGEALTKTDQNGTVHTYEYDSLGRQTLDSITTLANGTDGSIRAIATTYNGQGLIDTQTSYSTDTVNVGDVVNQIKNLYNGLGQLVQQFQEHSGAVSNSTLSVQYSYGDASTGSRLTSMTYPSGEIIGYSYGANGTLNQAIGRLDSLTETNGNTTRTLESYQYLGLGTVVVRNQPQAVDELTYVNTGSGFSAGGTTGGDEYTGLDAFGRVVDQKWVHDVLDGNGFTTYTAIDEYKYTYDANSNVLTKTNSLHTANNEAYNYDDLNQLANMTRGGSAYQSWDLDSLGNMDSVTTSGTTVSETHADNNELTGLGNATLTYDADGNTKTDDQGHHLVYDAWNRLVSVKDASNVTLETYSYDALGHRVTETPTGGLTNDLYYSSQWQVIQEDTDNAGLLLHADYVWSPVFVDALILRDDHLVGTYDGSPFNFSDRLYATQDANYNVTSLVAYSPQPADTDNSGLVDLNDLNTVLNHLGITTSNGAIDGDLNNDGHVDLNDLNAVLNELGTTEGVAERFVYDAYGNSLTFTKNWATTTDAYAWQYKYQGGRYDAITGLYDFRNREYSPTMMRWMTEDPMGYVDGMNNYGFVDDGPVAKTDPFGLWTAYIEIRVNKADLPLDFRIAEVRQKFFRIMGADPAGWELAGISNRVHFLLWFGLSKSPLAAIEGWTASSTCDTKSYRGTFNFSPTPTAAATGLSSNENAKDAWLHIPIMEALRPTQGEIPSDFYANEIAHENFYHGAYAALLGSADTVGTTFVSDGSPTWSGLRVMNPGMWFNFTLAVDKKK